MNQTAEIKSSVTLFSSMLRQIDQVTKFLETENLTFSDAQFAVQLS